MEPLRLGRLFGVAIHIHPTFWLLPLMILVESRGPELLWDLALLFAVFGSIALHECGHALMARLFGIPTYSIMLSPFGGVANLARIPVGIQETAISIAGPLVNFALAAILGLAHKFALADGPIAVLDQFAVSVAVANLFLGIFNLLPAFPLDGGRILRSLLGFVVSRPLATQISVVLGMILGGLLIVGGVLTLRLVTAMIGFLIITSCRAEWDNIRREQRPRRPLPFEFRIDERDRY